MTVNNAECCVCVGLHPDITCRNCKTSICNKCMRNQILNYISDYPVCVSCGIAYTLDEIYDIFEGKDFMNLYIPKAIEIAIEKDKGKIPECMPCCEAITTSKNFEKIYSEIALTSKTILRLRKMLQSTEFRTTNRSSPYENEVIRNINETCLKSVLDLYYNMDDEQYRIATGDSLPYYFGLTTINPVIHGLSIEMKRYIINQLEEIICKHEKYSRNILINLDPERGHESAKSILERYHNNHLNKKLGQYTPTKYLFKCSNEDCHGMIDASFICNLCKTEYCFECFAKVTNKATHVCKPEDISSFHNILESTKPCPKCASRIYKAEGCDQMFCTNCKTGFYWNTGKLILGSFHNPHREEWIRRTNNGDINYCDNIIHGTHTNPIINNYSFQLRLMNVHKHKLERVLNTRLNDFHYWENRCKFVLGEISEDEYKKVITKLESERMYTNYQLNILNSYVIPVTDIVNGALIRDREITNAMKDTYNFIYANKLLPLLKKIDEINTEKDNAENERILKETLCDTNPYIPKGERKKLDYFIKIISENIDFWSKIYDYEEEIKLIAEIVDTCNYELMKCAVMFKKTSHLVLDNLENDMLDNLTSYRSIRNCSVKKSKGKGKK